MSRLPESLGLFYTPPSIKILISSITLLTLLAALLDPLMVKTAGLSLESWLTLSYWGISNGYIWELISYSFLSNHFGLGITFSLILNLFFQMYVLWMVGSELVERFGSRDYLFLYFLAAILPAIFALVPLVLFKSSSLIGGPAGSIMAMLVAWSMLNHEREFLLFLTLPIKAKWLIFSYLGTVLLIDLSQGNIVEMVFMLAAASTGYAWALFKWELSLPFPSLQFWDQSLYSLKKRRGVGQKIVPLYQQQADDERFLDDMLSKISARGEKSLSWRERRRLNRISRSRTK